MKTRDEMIYDVIIALASNPAMIKYEDKETDKNGYINYEGAAVGITSAACSIVDDYLTYIG